MNMMTMSYAELSSMGVRRRRSPRTPTALDDGRTDRHPFATFLPPTRMRDPGMGTHVGHGTPAARRRTRSGSRGGRQAATSSFNTHVTDLAT